jgi:hypothetical protein
MRLPRTFYYVIDLLTDSLTLHFRSRATALCTGLRCAVRHSAHSPLSYLPYYALIYLTTLITELHSLYYGTFILPACGLYK